MSFSWIAEPFKARALLAYSFPSQLMCYKSLKISLTESVFKVPYLATETSWRPAQTSKPSPAWTCLPGRRGPRPTVEHPPLPLIGWSHCRIGLPGSQDGHDRGRWRTTEPPESPENVSDPLESNRVAILMIGVEKKSGFSLQTARTDANDERARWKGNQRK